MIETKEKEIGGMRFTVSQLPAMRALKTLNRIGRILGPAFAKASGASKGGDLGGTEIAAFADAIHILFDKLTDEELEGLTRALLDTATVDGKLLMPQFDTVMSGKVEVILQLLKFAFEVNYGNFFNAVRGLVSQAPAAE